MFSKNKPRVFLQKDAADCGPACLLTLINYYQGQSNLENLRRQSGTTVEGTTLLGLYEAASYNGFDAEGCEADLPALRKQADPLILHVTQENRTHHYVVFFGIKTKKHNTLYIIGDPGIGLVSLTEKELDSIWQSKYCLTLSPNPAFKTSKFIKSLKKKWLFDMLKKDQSLLTVTVILGIAIAVLSMSLAFFSQRLIDDILPKRNFQKLYFGVALVFIILLAKEVLSVIRQHFTIRQSQSFNTRVTNYFYSKLLHLPKPFFDTRKIGELTARLNDTSRIQKVISQLVGNTVIDVLLVPVTTLFLLSYSRSIGLVCITSMPVFFFIVYRFNRCILYRQKAVMSGYANTEANYISTLQCIEPIKNFRQQFLFTTISKTIYESFQEAFYQLGKKQISLSFTANSFSALFLTGILFFGSYQVLHQQLKIGEMVAVLSMCGTLLPSVANLALVSIPLSEAKIAFDRMIEFTSMEPEVQNEDGHTIGDFRSLFVENISFRFPGRSPLLTDISFSVQIGEIIAIMGENGCGKSTLAQILQRHYQPLHGQLLINRAIELNTLPLDNWRRICAIVPQHIHVFNGTVLENIAFGDAGAKSQEVVLFLQQYGFLPFFNTLPQSFMTLVGEEGINLSGGQKQIIALARALYHKPSLLILDEATAAMDRESEIFVINLLADLKQRMAIIFITHRLHILKSLSDRIYILEKGRITNEGDHRTLLQSPNLYSKYWSDMVQ